jgi:hypothetical protein
MLRRMADDSTYLRLRRMVLDLDPVAVPTAELPRVWGAMMDTGYPNGTATVVCLADGTTSLYTSTGGGILGAGVHESVAVPSRQLLTLVEAHLNQMPPSTEDTLPDPDWVVMRALTFTDRRAVPAEEDELAYNRHALAAVFHAFHTVITQLRLLDDDR